MTDRVKLTPIIALLRDVLNTYDSEDEDFRGAGRLLLGEALRQIEALTDLGRSSLTEQQK